MIDAMSAALDEIAAAFSDSRTDVCRLEMAEISEGRGALSGVVLEQKTLDEVSRQMAVRFAHVVLDVTQVRILRGSGPTLAVGTNLTGLYAKPSFLAEQISQLLNGWTLEVLLEEERWRFVRQVDGYLGWVYAPYLTCASGCTFTHLICTPEAGVRAEPRLAAPLATRLLGGTAVAVDAGEGPWRHLALTGDHSGWVRADTLAAFSALPHDEAARRSQIIADAQQFIGVQYLWGGCTAWGIDCSGFSQLLHRLSGVTVPRDADMQFTTGRPVDFPCQPGDLLFFGEAGDTRKITHVAISRGGWDIVHSSRRINGVYGDNVQQVDLLRLSFVGARTFLQD